MIVFKVEIDERENGDVVVRVSPAEAPGGSMGKEHAMGNTFLTWMGDMAKMVDGCIVEVPGFNIVPNWQPQEGGWCAKIPGESHRGAGWFTIHAIRRPDYCDRGKWHVLVETIGVDGLDDQEGFPGYYFDFEILKKEMTTWVNNREECRRAAGMRI